jgi:hypothetical protein
MEPPGIPGRFSRLGRPVRVGLVGCSATKRVGIHKARDLYLGAFFRRSLPLATRSCDEVWILSALYGLLEKNANEKKSSTSPHGG